MKYISALLLMSIWMVITVFLAITFIGMVVIIHEDEENKNPWFEIPKKALKAFEN